MPTFVMFDEAMNNIGSGVINLSTDTIKVVLTNGAPDQAAHDELADITQIANGNGYLTGGVTVAATWAETAGGSGVWRFDTADPSWTASSGAIAAHPLPSLTARRAPLPLRRAASTSPFRN
jgi:hypothetical protein